MKLPTVLAAAYAIWMAGSYTGVLFAQVTEAPPGPTASHVWAGIIALASMMFGFVIKEIWPAIKQGLRAARTDEETLAKGKRLSEENDKLMKTVERLREQLDKTVQAHDGEWRHVVNDKIDEAFRRISKLEP